MYGSDHIPDFLIDRTGTQYKLIGKKDIIDILRAKNKSRRKLNRKYASSSDIPSTPAGGGTNTPTPSTVTVDERNRPHADEDQYGDDSDYGNNSNDEDAEEEEEEEEEKEDANNDIDYLDIALEEVVQNTENSALQQQSYITLHVQSDSNDSSINLDQVHDDTSIRELLVNFKQFFISNLFNNFLLFLGLIDF